MDFYNHVEMRSDSPKGKRVEPQEVKHLCENDRVLGAKDQLDATMIVIRGLGGLVRMLD